MPERERQSTEWSCFDYDMDYNLPCFDDHLLGLDLDDYFGPKNQLTQVEVKVRVT